MKDLKKNSIILLLITFVVLFCVLKDFYLGVLNAANVAVDDVYSIMSTMIDEKSETTLNPKDDATRAEAATIIDRFLKK